MVYSCKKEVDKARDDRDKARKERDTCNQKLNSTTSKLNDTTNKLNTTTNNLNNTITKLNSTTNKLNDTKIKLNDTKTKLLETQAKLNQTIGAYNTQTDEMGYLTNRINVSEYFSVKEGLTQDEASILTTELKNISRYSYTAIQDQNTQLESEIDKYRNEYSTDDQKVNYEQQKIYLLLNANYILKCMYFFLFLIVAYFLYYTKNYSFYFKFILVIVLAIYPFVIYTAEKKTYDFFKFLWSFIHP